MSYALRLSEEELARYRMMAQRAASLEADLWTQAGIVPGARVADVGCGPGAMVATLAGAVGPDGYVAGVDADEPAVAAATAVLEAAGVTNAGISAGRAEDTGLAPASFDVVVLRHVLAHNGGAEQRIVDHLAGLLRPGGCLYVVDVDLTSARIEPSLPDADELLVRYLAWHAQQGNDVRIGTRLAELADRAGLSVVELREWFEVGEAPPGMRGPAWAARQALLDGGLATHDDLTRWALAFDDMDSWTTRPEYRMGTFAAVCARPQENESG